jgi:hypothetical protein
LQFAPYLLQQQVLQISSLLHYLVNRYTIKRRQRKSRKTEKEKKSRICSSCP